MTAFPPWFPRAMNQAAARQTVGEYRGGGIYHSVLRMYCVLQCCKPDASLPAAGALTEPRPSHGMISGNSLIVCAGLAPIHKLFVPEGMDCAGGYAAPVCPEM